MEKKINPILIWLLALAGIIFAVGIILAESGFDNAGYVLIGIGLTMIIVLLIIILVKSRDPITIEVERNPEEYDDGRSRKANEIYKQRVEQAIQIALGKKERIPITDDMAVVEYTGKINQDVCMVCKLFLGKKDKILQCPLCESLYHRDHLLEWITVKKKCPVCSQELYKK